MDHVAVFVDLVSVSPFVLVVTLNGSFTRFRGSTVAISSFLSCKDECGVVRSRDPDLSFLPERPLYSADGGPSDGDE